MLLDIEALDAIASPDEPCPSDQLKVVSQRQHDEDEAADFICRNVLEKDATFFDG